MGEESFEPQIVKNLKSQNIILHILYKYSNIPQYTVHAHLVLSCPQYLKAVDICIIKNMYYMPHQKLCGQLICKGKLGGEATY